MFGETTGEAASTESARMAPMACPRASARLHLAEAVAPCGLSLWRGSLSLAVDCLCGSHERASGTPREPSVTPREPSGRPREPSGNLKRGIRTQAAADRMMKPFPPQTKKAEVVQRGIMKTIEERILGWDQHATIVAGRFGAGKSVAVEEACATCRVSSSTKCAATTGRRSSTSAWAWMGRTCSQEVLRRVGDKLKRPPILLLDIPRTTKQGGGRWGFRFPLLLALLHSEAWIRFPASPSFCRRTVRWHTPGPEDSAALFRCAAVGSCASSSQGFFRGDRVRIVGRHGHGLRCRRGGTSGQLWVGDLTEDEAEKLLALHGHREDRMERIP